MIGWLLFLGAACAITFALRHDREARLVGFAGILCYLGLSALLAGLNYYEFGKVIL